MSAPVKQSSSWLAVYNGTCCVGHVIARGKRGYEAFDVDDRSVGLFRHSRKRPAHWRMADDHSWQPQGQQEGPNHRRAPKQPSYQSHRPVCDAWISHSTRRRGRS